MQSQVAEFFGLRLNPFVGIPRPSEIYAPPSFQRLEKQVIAAVSKEVPLVFIEGIQGIGKTCFLLYLADRLRLHQEFVHIDQFDREFVRRMKKGKSILEDLRDFTRALSTSPRMSNKRLVFLIDDLQKLDYNIAGGLIGLFSQGLFIDQVSIVATTAPDMMPVDKIDDTSLISYFTLKPLGLIETERYLFQKFFTAGLVFSNHLFSEKSIELIWRLSRGVPREINIWTQALMMYAYESKTKQISDDLVSELSRRLNLLSEYEYRQPKREMILRRNILLDQKAHGLFAKIKHLFRKFLQLFMKRNIAVSHSHPKL